MRPTQGSTIAWAITCKQDQYDRPIAGMTNFGPNMINTSPDQFEEQLATAIHEIAHALGFSGSFFGRFRKPDGSQWGASNVVQQFQERGNTVSKIITPNVVSKIKEHFNCQNWPNVGAELENHGGSGTAGSHWEKRIYFNEFMTGTSSANPKYSAISLALFEDSGWYRVDYSASEILDWGYQMGCDFAYGECSSWPQDAFDLGMACSGDGNMCRVNFIGYCNSGNPHMDGCSYVQGYSNGNCRDRKSVV